VFAKAMADGKLNQTSKRRARMRWGNSATRSTNGPKTGGHAAGNHGGGANAGLLLDGALGHCGGNGLGLEETSAKATRWRRPRKR